METVQLDDSVDGRQQLVPPLHLELLALKAPDTASSMFASNPERDNDSSQSGIDQDSCPECSCSLTLEVYQCLQDRYPGTRREVQALVYASERGSFQVGHQGAQCTDHSDCWKLARTRAYRQQPTSSNRRPSNQQPPSSPELEHGNCDVTSLAIVPSNSPIIMRGRHTRTTKHVVHQKDCRVP